MGHGSEMADLRKTDVVYITTLCSPLMSMVMMCISLSFTTAWLFVVRCMGLGWVWVDDNGQLWFRQRSSINWNEMMAFYSYLQLELKCTRTVKTKITEMILRERKHHCADDVNVEDEWRISSVVLKYSLSVLSLSLSLSLAAFREVGRDSQRSHPISGLTHWPNAAVCTYTLGSSWQHSPPWTHKDPRRN